MKIYIVLYRTLGHLSVHIQLLIKYKQNKYTITLSIQNVNINTGKD